MCQTDHYPLIQQLNGSCKPRHHLQNLTKEKESVFFLFSFFLLTQIDSTRHHASNVQSIDVWSIHHWLKRGMYLFLNK